MIPKKTFQSALFLLLLVTLTHNSFGINKPKKQIIWTAEWSANGEYYAFAGNIDCIKIYNSKDNTLYKSLPVKNTVTAIKWHPTKNILVYTTQLSKDKSSIYNLETEEKTVLAGISVDGARGLDWKYDGSFFAIADNDGKIIIYNEKGVLKNTFTTENSKSFTSIDWHPTKNILLTTGNNIKLFDIKGNLLKTIQHRNEDVLLLSAAWHPSGKFFVCGDYGDGFTKTYLQFWDENGTLIQTNDISKGEYRSLIWNKTGSQLFTVSDKLRIWDSKGKLLYEVASPDYLWGLSLNEKEGKIITSSIIGEVYIRDKKGKILMKIE